MPLIVHLTSLLLQILLLCPEIDSAVPEFISTPSNPWKVLEGQNITFMWRYTLDGTILLAKFVNVTGGATTIIASNSGGSTTVRPNLQQRFTADISVTRAKITMLAVQMSDDREEFELDITTNNTGNIQDQVELIVQSEPKFTKKSQDLLRVNESSDLQLFCEASGEPSPNITWTKDDSNDVLHAGSTLNLPNVNSKTAGTYHCKADNGAGSTIHTMEVIVDFLSRIDLNVTYYVAREGNAYLHCQVEGHPLPTITWTPCDSNIKCNESFLNISEVQVSRAIYTCRGSNDLGEALANTSLVIGGREIYLTLIITGVECTEKNGQAVYDQSVWEKLKAQVDTMFKSNNYIGAERLAVRCGSLHVDLVLRFKNVVAEDWVLSNFRGAVQNGKLGKLSVNASSIVGIPPVIKSTVTPPTTKRTPKSDQGSNIALIVGLVVGGVVLVVIIVAVVLLCRKRKCCNCCAKGTKEVSDDEAAGPQKSGTSSGTGTNGYDDAGSAYAQPNRSSLPPTKTAEKKEKKPGKKGKDLQPAALPLYAQVDKTKKKPKQPENTYDDANDQRKRWPGEVTYTAVDHSNQGASLPRDAANQTTRPPPYTETTYAVLV